MNRRDPNACGKASPPKLILRIGRAVWQRLQAFHLAPEKRRESLSYLWARCQRVTGAWLVLLADDTPWFPFGDDCLVTASAGQVTLRPDVLNGMLVHFARSEFNCLVNVHDHWFAQGAQFSGVDDDDDLRFDRYLRERFEPMLARRSEIGDFRHIFNVSMVLGRGALDARLTDVRCLDPFVSLDRALVLDDHFQSLAVRATSSQGTPSAAADTDRQRSFVDAGVQAQIGRWHPGLVGCGGLGSVLAEGLMRLGVRQMTLIDPDVLEASNLNRWQGGCPSDLGKPKAEVLANRLRAMWPEARIHAVTRSLDHPRSVWALSSADAAVCTIDNDAGRWLLNHLSVQYLLPSFDAGVLITEGATPDFQSRFFAVIPGVTGCTDCKSFQLLDRDTVLERYANAATTRVRRAAGYVQDRPDLPTPSAYALNQRAASTASLEILNYFTGWRPMATVIQETWRTHHLQRADRENYPERPWAECPVCSLRLGIGNQLGLPRRSSTVLRAGDHKVS